MTGSLVGLFAVWCIGWFVDLWLVCWLSNCVLVGWLPGWHACLSVFIHACLAGDLHFCFTISFTFIA